MLLPSSIQRADDFVGIAIPTVPLSAATAGITNDATPKAAAAINEIMDFISLSLVNKSAGRKIARPETVAGSVLDNYFRL
jgi:hypothetical protein